MRPMHAGNRRMRHASVGAAVRIATIMRFLCASPVVAHKFVSFEELTHGAGSVADDTEAAASVNSVLNCMSEVQTGKVT
jgi:hypothetical protein